jgi:hypothetical protein
MVRELAAHLEQRLVQLGAPAAGVKGAAAVEQVRRRGWMVERGGKACTYIYGSKAYTHRVLDAHRD